MVFAVYLPPQAGQAGLPVLYWLSGPDLHRRELHAEGRRPARGRRAGHRPSSRRTPARAAPTCRAIRTAPGTSAWAPASTSTPPRSPGRQHYRMHDYVVQELPALIEAHFPASSRRGISGHSMGGHGALVCALRNPGATVGVGLRADQPPDGLPLGQGLQPLPGRRPPPGASGMPACCWPGQRAPADAGRPGRGDDFLANSSSPKRCARPRKPRAIR
jgi:S-formylglutathione hydrolase